MNRKRKEAIAARLAEIAKEHGGRLTPAAVVADARSQNSVLHDCFEWDDTKAASQWRIEQARALISSITVSIESNERIISAPFYVRDPSAANSEQGYTSVTSLRDDKALARDSLEYELRRAIGCLERVLDLAEVFGFTEEAQHTLEHLSSMREVLVA